MNVGVYFGDTWIFFCCKSVKGKKNELLKKGRWNAFCFYFYIDDTAQLLEELFEKFRPVWNNQYFFWERIFLQLKKLNLLPAWGLKPLALDRMRFFLVFFVYLSMTFFDVWLKKAGNGDESFLKRLLTVVSRTVEENLAEVGKWVRKKKQAL